MFRTARNRAGYLAASVAVALALASTASADSISRILGAAGYKEPLGTVFIICQSPSNCERRTSPSFTSTNRVWAGTASCRTSTTGGATWGNCATQPLNSGGQEFYAEASDGSVIGVGRPAAKKCVIKRSTDNAATWATVYDSATVTCGGAVSGGTMLKCVAGGQCVFVFQDTATIKGVVLTSADNGQTWTEALVTAAAIGAAPGSLDWDGTLGIAAPTSSTGTAKAFYTTGGGTWVVSGNWPVDNQSCWGSFILNSDTFAMCYNATRKYHVRTKAGAVVNNSWFANPLLGTNQGGVSFSPRANIVYSAISDQPPSGAAPVGLYASQDAGRTFNRLGISLAASNGMREGDMWESPVDGCVYVSAGASFPIFARIC